MEKRLVRGLIRTKTSHAKLTDDAEKIVFRQLLSHTARLECDAVVRVEVNVTQGPGNAEKSAVGVNHIYNLWRNENRLRYDAARRG